VNAGNTLIIGASGMLGHDLRMTFPSADVVTHAELDVLNLEAVLQKIHTLRPSIIINAAAFTKVDLCESDVDAAFAVNAVGARNLAVASTEVGAALVHFSTDYVFSGEGTAPYREYDPTDPKSIYGQSKLAGERAIQAHCAKHYIIRTSWLYGGNGPNFVDTMLRLGLAQGKVRVVDDQVGSPTYTADLAKVIEALIGQPAYGVYHLTNQGQCSWHQFACDIFDVAGIDVQVEAISSSELSRPAPRPAYSVLDNQMWRLSGFTPLRHYREALRTYLETSKKKG